MLIQLSTLLEPSEVVPLSVQRCADRAAELELWVQFSRNDPAMSCQDAAQKRKRLGHRGIPLRDELKSFLGEYDNADARVLFLAHCRGDRELDFDKVARALGVATEIRRVSPDSVAALGSAYGIVNPFMVDNLVQLFDSELLHPLGVPGTVMTNAGDHSWAVEFSPRDLVPKLSGARWADVISVDTPSGQRPPEQSIGILTGNPCDSGLELCSSINAHLRRLMGRGSLGDVSMPRIVLVSTPQIGISMEMDVREGPLRQALLTAMEELCSMGATIIGHPAHTTHFFAADLAARAAELGARFVSMSEATASRVKELGVTEIALLGTRFVTDAMSPWSVYNSAFNGLLVHRPSEIGWRKVHDLGYEVQQNGLTPLAFNWMRDLLRDEVPRECKHVVLAMTEFAPVARQLRNRGRHGKTLVEPIDIYGEAIARAYLNQRGNDEGRSFAG